MSGFQLWRDDFGRLVMNESNDVLHIGVHPVRAFPIQSPESGIALVLPDGKEVAWIDQLSDLATDIEQLIREELQAREFMPEIHCLQRVSSFATPSTWFVTTDRGDTSFVLKGEEDIRRVGAHGLLISDSHGIHFLIRDLSALDWHSRKLLDRFL